MGLIASIGDGVLIYLVSNWFKADSINSSTLSNEFALIALVFTVVRPLAVIYLNNQIFRQLGKEEAKLSADLFRIAQRHQWSTDKPIEVGEFVNLVTNSSSALVRGIIVRGSLGISALINLLAIVAALVIVDPINTAIFLFITVLLLLFSNRIYSNMLSTLSVDKMYAMESVAGLVNVAWKSTKILNVMPSKSFEANYSRKRSELGNIGARTEFLSVLPRSLFEIYLGIGLFVAFILSSKSLGSADSFGKIVLYGAVAFRIFPLMAQIQSIGIQMKIEFQSALIAAKTLKSDQQLNLSNSSVELVCDVGVVFSTKDLYFSYAKTNYSALRKINIEIKEGERIAIVGKSGSGKTTLINILMGLLIPTKGSIAKNEITEKVYGYVPQTSVPCGLPICNSIALEWDTKCIDKSKIDALISRFNEMTMFQENNLIDSMLDTELSVGQQQALGVMRALYRSPEILILDEPSSSLDENSQNEIMNIVFENNSRTVIMITHRKETLKHVDRILYLKEGQIFSQKEVGQS